MKRLVLATQRVSGALKTSPLPPPPHAPSREVCRHFRLGTQVYPCFRLSPYLRSTASWEHPALWETAEIIRTSQAFEGKSV